MKQQTLPDGTVYTPKEIDDDVAFIKQDLEDLVDVAPEARELDSEKPKSISTEPTTPQFSDTDEAFMDELVHYLITRDLKHASDKVSNDHLRMAWYEGLTCHLKTLFDIKRRTDDKPPSDEKQRT